jgi:hypothetical protein
MNHELVRNLLGRAFSENASDLESTTFPGTVRSLSGVLVGHKLKGSSPAI